MLLPLAFLNLGFSEMALVAIVALLLYGSDLPEVARTWGKAYQEFRRNLHGIRNDLNNVIYSEPEEDAPRKLQYYPEFQEPEAEVEGDAESESETVAESTPAAETPSVPVATTPAASVKPTTSVASDQPVRNDAHGAA